MPVPGIVTLQFKTLAAPTPQMNGLYDVPSGTVTKALPLTVMSSLIRPVRVRLFVVVMYPVALLKLNTAGGSLALPGRAPTNGAFGTPFVVTFT